MLSMLLQQGDASGQTPLHLAAIQGHVTTIDFLLEAGAKPTVQNAMGQTAVHCAIAHGNYEAMVTLLNHAAGE